MNKTPLLSASGPSSDQSLVSQQGTGGRELIHEHPRPRREASGRVAQNAPRVTRASSRRGSTQSRTHNGRDSEEAANAGQQQDPGDTESHLSAGIATNPTLKHKDCVVIQVNAKVRPKSLSRKHSSATIVINPLILRQYLFKQ